MLVRAVGSSGKLRPYLPDLLDDRPVGLAVAAGPAPDLIGYCGLGAEQPVVLHEVGGGREAESGGKESADGQAGGLEGYERDKGRNYPR